MKSWLALPMGLVLLWVAGCDALPGRPDPAERYRRPTEILDFETLYARNCSGCHGATGRLGPARPLADPLYLAYAGAAQLRKIVADGVPGTSMPAFGQAEGGLLTDAQVDALVQGAIERWGDASKLAGVSLPGYQPGTGNPAHGQVTFGRFCADCHGADGNGGKQGGSVVNPDFLALVSDQMLRTSVVAGRPDLGMPDWRKLGARPMQPQEIDDVVAWMTSRRTRYPKPH